MIRRVQDVSALASARAAADVVLQGAIDANGTIVDNSKFFVYSTDSGDDGTLQYQVTVIP